MQIPLTFRYNILTARNWKIRSLQVLNHIGFVYACTRGWTPWLLGSLVVYFLMFCVGVNIGVHRYFSHGNFKTSALAERFMGCWMCLATLGSPLAWVGMHRAHHRFSDTPRDPHTPLQNGRVTIKSFLNAYVGLWGEYIAATRQTFDLRHRRVHKLFHFYYFGVILAYIAILGAISPMLVIYLYCVPAVMAFHAASMIVTLGHSVGSRPYATGDKSRNNVVLHWLTLGEGLHNAHHAHPNHYIYRGTPWYFFDLPGYIIEYFLKIKRPTSSATLLRNESAR